MLLNCFKNSKNVVEFDRQKRWQFLTIVFTLRQFFRILGLGKRPYGGWGWWLNHISKKKMIWSSTLVVECVQSVELGLNNFVIQCKPLNVITLGHHQSDNINRMITLTKGNIYQGYELYFKFWVITELKIKN